MSGFGGGFGSGSSPGQSGGFRTGDQRGQGGANREAYRLEHEGAARAEYDSGTEAEVSGRRRPGPLERFKRWFSARF